MTKHKSLSKNKTLEVQFELWDEDSNWFEFHFEWSKKCDHAGLDIRIALWKFAFYFSICDNRHWNYDKNRWNTYNDEKKRSADCGTLTEDD